MDFSKTTDNIGTTNMGYYTGNDIQENEEGNFFLSRCGFGREG